MEDPTKRFSSRAADYALYRPGYPAAIIPFLSGEAGLNAAATVADIGSGTGILTELFLRNGNRVFAVEPNDAMRDVAEHKLRHYPGFVSVKGTAEHTGLVNRSVNLIVAGQAFHWFDPDTAKKEFKRIIISGGYVVLVWNERKINTAFLSAYEELILRYATDYAKVNHKNISPDIIAAFFSPAPVSFKSFPNEQLLDFEGLKGRLLSSSYIPAAGHASFPAMISDLQVLFDRYAVNNRIRIDYDTNVYYGKFN